MALCGKHLLTCSEDAGCLRGPSKIQVRSKVELWVSSYGAWFMSKQCWQLHKQRQSVHKFGQNVHQNCSLRFYNTQIQFWGLLKWNLYLVQGSTYTLTPVLKSCQKLPLTYRTTPNPVSLSCSETKIWIGCPWLSQKTAHTPTNSEPICWTRNELYQLLRFLSLWHQSSSLKCSISTSMQLSWNFDSSCSQKNTAIALRVIHW